MRGMVVVRVMGDRGSIYEKTCNTRGLESALFDNRIPLVALFHAVAIFGSVLKGKDHLQKDRNDCSTI